MKIALIHDYLCGMGGSERVFQYMCEEFEDADIYTLAYNPTATLPYFNSREINTTWLNRFVQSMDSFRWSFPIATHVMESIDLSDYDIVLSSSATVAKYVRVPHGKHICYCYIPTRALWQVNNYFGNSWKSVLIKPFLSFLKKHDLKAANNIDKFISISETTKKHILNTYSQNSEIIYSPIDLKKFKPSKELSTENHYLIVSRLEQWKKVDYAIEAFNKLGLPLKIIGTGAEEKKLKRMAQNNIHFLGEVDDTRLAEEYSIAKAVIFTPFLEYGLIPLEANACGTPVICYGRGGVNETMIPVSKNTGNPSLSTAIFYYEQSADSLIDAVNKFQTESFDSNHLINHASRWGIPEFKSQLRKTIEEIGGVG